MLQSPESIAAHNAATNDEVFYKLASLQMPSGFHLNHFLFRYIAAENYAREPRRISRMRLALVASGIPTTDKEAFLLFMQMEKFQFAYEYLKRQGKITTEHLCEVNRIVASTKPGTGKIRSSDQWLDHNAASYVIPNTKELPELLHRLNALINNDSIDALEKAHDAHARLLLIHPFTDGNARTARILWQVLAEQASPTPLPPFIYRLNKTEKRYQDAVNAFSNNNIGVQHDFWQESNIWADKQLKEMARIANWHDWKIHKKTSVTSLSMHALAIIKYAWKNPVMYLPKLQRLLELDSYQLKEAIDELTKTKVLEPKRVHYPDGQIIFECTDISNCFSELENYLFTHL